MSTNFLQEGDTLTLIAPSGGVVAGKGYVIGTLFVVALVTAAQGEKFAAATEGVFTMTKEAAQSAKNFSAGEAVFWNDTNKEWAKTNAAYYKGAGIVVEDATTTATTCKVKLTGVNGGVVGGGS